MLDRTKDATNENGIAKCNQHCDATKRNRMSQNNPILLQQPLNNGISLQCKKAAVPAMRVWVMLEVKLFQNACYLLTQKLHIVKIEPLLQIYIQMLVNLYTNLQKFYVLVLCFGMPFQEVPIFFPFPFLIFFGHRDNTPL